MDIFNTGRLYSREGQRIAWEVVQWNGEQFILFVDVDRMIDGIIPCPGTASRDTVLREYDHCRYLPTPGELWEKRGELRRAGTQG